METRQSNTVSFTPCDFTQAIHCQALADLIEHYKMGEMGDGKPFSPIERLRVVDGLASHPARDIIFVLDDGNIAGVAVCFSLFSTFSVRPYLYIHDLVIHEQHRGKGLGKKLLEHCIALSTGRKYCKVCLEVRHDNERARNLYTSAGFAECVPPMHFWTREIHRQA